MFCLQLRTDMLFFYKELRSQKMSKLVEDTEKVMNRQKHNDTFQVPWGLLDENATERDSEMFDRYNSRSSEIEMHEYEG